MLKEWLFLDRLFRGIMVNRFKNDLPLLGFGITYFRAVEK
jgi:hypothetical protein